MSGSQFFSRILGRSVEGREVIVQANFDLNAAPPANLTLLIGGQHGDEPATVRLLENFRDEFLAKGLEGLPTAIIALANPDGLVANTRYNARGADLNRNCGFNWRPDSEEPPGSGPWSEPESCLLRDFILGWQPTKIVSLHWALAELDADGPQSTPLANAIWAALSAEQRAPYRLRVAAVGRGERRLQQTYAVCPGSLGQWCGYGLQYRDGTSPAMITLELPYDPGAPDRPEILDPEHLPFVHNLWKNDAEGYLRAAMPAVRTILLAACRFGAAIR
jgi:hypothetical protein